MCNKYMADTNYKDIIIDKNGSNIMAMFVSDVKRFI